MNQYLVSQQLLQAILEYLAKKPYAEVATLVKHIEGLKPYKLEEKAEQE